MKRVALLIVALLVVTSCYVKNQRYNPVPRSVVAIEPNGNRVDRVDPACDPREHACLAFLEFDEMGERWDRNQPQVALDLIQRAKTLSTHPIVVVFVHGWKNNANDRDGEENHNVVGFEGVLNFIRTLPKYASSPIVGIYLSWRGDLIPDYWPIRRQLSVTNRETAATRIPGSSMTAALTQIMIQTHSGPPGARLIMVGHSFGGLILERALTQAMTDYVLRQTGGAAAGRDNTWADLVVFVNSAAAASEGKQMLDFLKSRRAAYRSPVEADRLQRTV